MTQHKYLAGAIDTSYTELDNIISFNIKNYAIELYVYNQNSNVYAYTRLDTNNAIIYKLSEETVGKDARGKLTVKQQAIASALSKDLQNYMDKYLAINGYIKQEKGVYKFDGKTDMQRALDNFKQLVYKETHENLWD